MRIKLVNYFRLIPKNEMAKVWKHGGIKYISKYYIKNVLEISQFIEFQHHNP